VSNCAIVLMCLLVFSCLRQRYRLVYQKNSWENWGYSDPEDRSDIHDGVPDVENDDKEHWASTCDAGGPLPRRPRGRFLDWIPASFALDTPEIVSSAGLDQAMLVEFANLGMSTFALIGIPMCLVIAPLHVYFGEGRASSNDYISWQDFSHVKHGSNLCWVHAFMVWYVVFVVDCQIYACQEKFVKLRVQWLETMPHIRACTILVEGIPFRCRTNKLLKDFFNEMFGGRNVVESTNIVVRTDAVEFAMCARDTAKRAYLDAKSKVDTAEPEDTKQDRDGDDDDDDNASEFSARQLMLASSRALSEVMRSTIKALEEVYLRAEEDLATEQQELQQRMERVETWTEEQIMGDGGPGSDSEETTELLQEQEEAELEAATSTDGSPGRRKAHQHKSMHEAISSQLAANSKLFIKHLAISDLNMNPSQQEIASLYSSTGFVTFRTRYDAIMALRLTPYTSDRAEFIVSGAPEPADVEYADMKSPAVYVKAWAMLGWTLIVILFLSFLPLIGFIGAFCNVYNVAKYDSSDILSDFIAEYPNGVRVWNGIAAAMGLNLVLSFLPTTLVLISTACFQQRAHSWFQYDLQKFYFFFLLVFQLLVVSMANTLVGAVRSTILNPVSLVERLSGGMSQTTTFFLTIFASQWTVIAMEHTRMVQVIKYYMYKRMSMTPVEAIASSEPEDQDYYGMGARSARYTALFIIGLAFVSLCPVICVLAFIMFTLMRLVVGYQVVYAETKKADLGGKFWVLSLQHLQFGIIIYICGMSGVLAERSLTWKPMLLSICAVFYMLESMWVFKGKFHWESVSHEEVVKTQRREEAGVDYRYRAAMRDTYLQPELVQAK